MNEYPEFIKIGSKEYKINTDFRVAIRCNEICESNVHEIERAMAVICLLFGKEALEDAEKQPELYEKFMKASLKYLLCLKEKEDNDEKPDMDFIEDEGYIRSSFQYDYKYDPYDLEHVHWFKYMNDLNNLSNSELGDCCVLNRVRNLRNIKLSEIKDRKERERIKKAQERVALKKYKKEYRLTEEQERSMQELNNMLGI